MPTRKVMIIGLDAVTLELIRPWAEEGRLPNLARFLDEGACGPLRSTLPPGSPAAWSTFATGMNPGGHGILSFYQLHADSYEPRLMNAATRAGATFWEVAGQHGIRGGVLNLPFTFPPRPYNGFLISGMLSPTVGRRIASPPEVLDDLVTASPDYAIDVDLVRAPVQDPQVFMRRVMENLEARLRAALGLYRKHRPPLFCVVFVAADRICHYFWPYLEAAREGRAHTEEQKDLAAAIRTVHEELDKAVGALVAEAGDDTDVIILSDHGAGPFRKGLNLRKVLAEAGLLAERPTRTTDRLKRYVVWRFARHAPRCVKGLAKSLFPGLTQSAAGVIACQGVDFRRSRSYPAGATQGIFVNLSGRQPWGIVEPGVEYETVRDQIIEVLSQLRDPDTGKLIASKVHRREEVWSGPCLEGLPDVILEQAERICAVPTFAEDPGDSIFYALPEPSWNALHHLAGHRPDGVLLAMGPRVTNTTIRDAQIADVPPTILALLGCPIPENFDGRALSEILTGDVKMPGTAAARLPERVVTDELTDEDKAAVEDRLRGLGYL
jgi:predicted AlkP superfamily phosphohydrolase/phosphomutase